LDPDLAVGIPSRGSGGGERLNAAAGGGGSPETTRSRASAVGLGWDQAEKIEERTGNHFGGKRGGQLGRGGRAAAARGSGVPTSPRGCGETRPREK
jgi:hypothetical protein